MNYNFLIVINLFFNYMNSSNNSNYVKLIKFLRILWHLRYNWFQKWKFFGNFLSIILLLVKNSFQKIFQIVAMNSENSQRYYRCKNFKYVKEILTSLLTKRTIPKLLSHFSINKVFSFLLSWLSLSFFQSEN